MPLPDLAPWQGTIRSLHAAMQVLRSARLLGVEPRPNERHYGAIPTLAGATTGALAGGLRVDLDYGRGAIVGRADGRERFALAVTGRSQTQLFDEAFARLAEAGLDGEPDPSKIEGEAPLAVDPEAGAGYAAVQWRMLTALALARARMDGRLTPVMLWPHGFDLSTIWFARGEDENEDPHVNLGFSPGTPELPEPYLYAYAWPVPEALKAAIPPQMSWQADWGTPGAALRYADLRDAAAPEAEAARILLRAWDAARRALASA